MAEVRGSTPLGPIIFKKMLLYTLKPNKKRAIIPKVISVLFLCILFYLGIQLNLYLLEVPISTFTAVLIISALFILFVFESIMTYSKADRLTYYFHDDKLTVQNKELRSIDYLDVQNTSIKQNLVDKVFNTGTIILAPDFSIKFINNSSQLYNWINQLVARSRQMRGF